jgi:hypothetical protein
VEPNAFGTKWSATDLDVSRFFDGSSDLSVGEVLGVAMRG